MSNNNAATSAPVVTAVPSSTPAPQRKKSTETVLKLSMNQIKRDLAKLKDEVEAFEAMEKKQPTIKAEQEKLQEKLDKVKADLIKELGLG